MAFKFEGLKVWHLSLELTDEVELLAQTFPKHECICWQAKSGDRLIRFH